MARSCEICGRKVSRYVCQECGRAICESCIEPDMWLCLDCYGKMERTTARGAEFEETAPMFPPALKLFFIAFVLIFLGILILMLTAILSGLTKASGLILFLGPIPVIFGVGENLALLLIIAAILTILCIVVFIIFSRRIINPWMKLIRGS